MIFSRSSVIKRTTFYLEGDSFQASDKLEINGYYYVDDPLAPVLMFFDDGSACYFYSFKDDVSVAAIKENLSEAIPTYGRRKRWGVYWGVYKIQHDTLIVSQYLREFDIIWTLEESRYKIINNTTIQRIYESSIYPERYPYPYGTPWTDKGTILHFASADSLPSSDCWLKEQKWIWRNRSDWEAYMQKIGKRKKKS
jgi:hypothetical protein